MVVTSNTELNIVMVGPRGVGKTSLLAAMHEEFNKTFERANLQTWTSDTPTMQRIEECKKTLKNIDCRLKKFVTPTDPEENPFLSKGFIFELGSAGKKFLKLHFTDPSGEYFYAHAEPQQKEYIYKKLNTCDAIIIPIDSTALMETKLRRATDQKIGDWHEEKNMPSRITNLLRDAFANGQIKSPRLVILAPVKSESYVKYERDADSLLEHVKIGYSKLLDFLKSDELIDKVSVVVSPVQTIGNIVFAHHKQDTETGQTKFEYHKSPIDADYAPKDGDQPLRYILLFLINLYLTEKKKALEEEKEKLESLKNELSAKSEKYEQTKQEFDYRKRKSEERNRVWWGFRQVANFFDDRHAEFALAQNQFNVSSQAKTEVESQVQSVTLTIEATEEQINTFSNALFRFALGCKNTNGFAILQGYKYLEIPQSLF